MRYPLLQTLHLPFTVLLSPPACSPPLRHLSIAPPFLSLTLRTHPSPCAPPPPPQLVNLRLLLPAAAASRSGPIKRATDRRALSVTASSLQATLPLGGMLTLSGPPSTSASTATEPPAASMPNSGLAGGYGARAGPWGASEATAGSGGAREGLEAAGSMMAPGASAAGAAWYDAVLLFFRQHGADLEVSWSGVGGEGKWGVALGEVSIGGREFGR